MKNIPLRLQLRQYRLVSGNRLTAVAAAIVGQNDGARIRMSQNMVGGHIRARPAPTCFSAFFVLTTDL